MTQANAGATGTNGAVPQMGGAAGQAAAPVAVPVVAPVAVALFPQGLAHHGRFDVDGVLLDPPPTKSNGSCKILPKIADETEP